MPETDFREGLPRPKKGVMKAIGVTPEERPVFNGIFKMVDTYGMPLEILLDIMKERGFVVDWLQFYKDAEKAGWPIKTTINHIS